MRWRLHVDERGISLVELLITVLLVALAVVAIPAHFRSGTQIWEKGERHAEVMQNALIGMEQMARELKQAKEITSISGSGSTEGHVEFTDAADDTGRFEFVSTQGYLQHNPDVGGAGALNNLSGPLTSLEFTGYESDDVTEATYPEDVKSVLIQMDTRDDRELADDIPLSTRVYIGDLLDRGEADEFAIFGSTGVYMKNNSYVSGNVGSNGTYDPDDPSAGGIYLRQNNEIDGGIYFAPGSEEDGIDYQGSGNSVTGDIFPNVYTELPCPTDFSGFSYGADHTLGNGATLTLNPGTNPGYGDLMMTGNGCTLNLSAGQYYFRRFIATGNNAILNLDLSVSPGSIEIFVEKEIEIGNNFEIVLASPEGGTPENVYFETHYNNPDPDLPAVIMRKADWIGTIYAVYDDIGEITGAGGGRALNDINLLGSLYSGITIRSPGLLPPVYGGHVYMETNCNIYYYCSDYFSALPYDNCVFNDSEDL